MDENEGADGHIQDILFGAGSVNRLREAVDRFHWDRLLLCSTGSQRRGGHIASLERALDERLVAIYEPLQPHVPDFQIAEVLKLADEKEIDAVIGVGRGSPIGMAKKERKSFRWLRATSSYTCSVQEGEKGDRR